MRVVAGLVAVLLASGCSTGGYLFHAAAGQYQLIHEARPLEDVISDSHASATTRRLLVEVEVIKAFAQRHGLKATANYRRYVDLHRAAAVWVVQGCAPLAFEPHRWWFPIVGSVPYLGFFDPRGAKEAAEAVRADTAIDGVPLDVSVRTASAYSTLGWFRDPVLSTMLHEGPGGLATLAETVLHESVHATLYIPGQSTFDESLADYVAVRLTEVMLAERFGAEHSETKAWRASLARTATFHEALERAHAELKALYASALPKDEKLARKAARLASLQQELKTSRQYNNADLMGVKTYTAGAEGFARLEAACGGLQGLLRALPEIRAADFERPQQTELDAVLDRLSARVCPVR